MTFQSVYMLLFYYISIFCATFIFQTRHSYKKKFETGFIEDFEIGYREGFKIGFAEGFKIGYKEGITEIREKIARKLLKAGKMSKEDIAKVTNLTPDKIQQLAEQSRTELNA